MCSLSFFVIDISVSTLGMVFSSIACVFYLNFDHHTLSLIRAGRYSSVGIDVAWESRGTAIDPRVRHIFS